jgi:hypothetical protein
MSYERLAVVHGRTPMKLKEALLAIPVPSQIVQGSWFQSGGIYGVWVMCDRPVKEDASSRGMTTAKEMPTQTERTSNKKTTKETKE